MSPFADSSALVKLYADEVGHELVRPLGLLMISQLARVEVPAAIWRKQRMGELSPGQARLLVEEFEADYFGAAGEDSRFIAVAAAAPVLDDAARLAAVHGLRAYDAVQLASACAARAADPGCTAVVAFDEALRAAAAAQGFRIIGS
jgi:predicted nucleic acid-binding protein